MPTQRREYGINRAIIPEWAKAAFPGVTKDTLAWHNDFLRTGTSLKLETLGMGVGSKAFEIVKRAEKYKAPFYGFTAGSVGLGIPESRSRIRHEYAHEWFRQFSEKFLTDPSKSHEFWDAALKKIEVGPLYQELLDVGYSKTQVAEEYMVRMATDRWRAKKRRDPVISLLQRVSSEDTLLSKALDSEKGFMYLGLREVVKPKDIPGYVTGTKHSTAQLTSFSKRVSSAMVKQRVVGSKGGTASSKMRGWLKKISPR